MNRHRFTPLLELTRIRFLEFLREPEAVFWTFVFPILLAGGLGIAFRARPADVVPIAVIETSAASPLLASLSRQAELKVSTLSGTDAAEALRLGRVALVVDWVNDSARFVFDPARAEARSARLIVERALSVARDPRGQLPIAERTVSEPGSRYIDFVLPGLLAMNLMGSGVWSIGFAIVDARRKKLLKRFVATPMARSHYLASFLLMRLTLMVVELAVITAFGVFVFGVPLRGGLGVFLLIGLMATLAFGSIGLLIASRARTVEAASGMMNVVMLPMWVGSGVFFAATNFPEVVQPFIQLLPLTAVVDALRANMLQGAGLGAIGSELAILAGWLVICFAAALKLFRWK